MKIVMLEPKNKRAPQFVARINYPDEKLRAYVHSNNFEEAYGGDIYVALGSLATTINKRKIQEKRKGIDFLIAAMWGANEELARIDFFGYHMGIKWGDAPEIDTWFTQNGVLVPGTFCGDGAIVIGHEEEYRRTTRNLGEYMRNPPEIPGLKVTRKVPVL